MIVKTVGIILSKVKYSDSSIILKVFTENFGLKSFIINSPHKKSSPVRSSYLEPLTILDLDFYIKQNQSIYRIKDAKLIYSPIIENEDYTSKSVLLFFNDLLIQFLIEHQPINDFFNFGKEYLLNFKQEEELKNKPLNIILHFLRLSGFLPINNFSESNNIFNMQEGEFSQIIKSNMDIKLPISNFISKILIGDFNKLSLVNRNEILDILILYSIIHIPNFKEPKSLDIIRML